MSALKAEKNSVSVPVDVSVIVAMHREGILGYKTLRNIAIMVGNAKKNGISCEILIGLDNADDLTKKIVTDFQMSLNNTQCSVFESSFGDPGLNRNNLLDRCEGKYILIHDGDDLFTQNFICEAYRMAEQATEPAVYIPQIQVNFDAHHYMMPYMSTESKLISKQFLFETNYFTSQFLVPRSLVRELRYESSENGWGYEDWWFNLELVASGVKFLLVPNTAFYYRRKKSNSLLSAFNSDSVLMRKTRLYDPKTFLMLPPAIKRRTKAPNVKEDPGWLRALRKVTVKSSLAVMMGKYFSTQKALHAKAATAIGRRILHIEPHINLPEDWTKKARDIMERNKKELPPRMKSIGVGKKLIEEWGKLNQIEPMIRASWDMFEFIPISFYPTDSGISRAYYDFCKKFADQKITDLVFVPHMVRGGAELATIELTKALCAQGKKVLVVATLDSRSVWAGRIKEIDGADFVDSKDLLIHVPDESMRMVFWARVIQYWNVKYITVINSEFGYKFLQKYSRQLKDMRCKSYVHTYAFDVTEDGFLFNYIPNGLVELYGTVDKYITDSRYYKKLLHTINGFSEEKIAALYIPTDPALLRKKTVYKRKNKVIYAARVCNQKIADVAVGVGKELAEHGIELHFYGNIDPEYAENDKFLNMIKNLPTVQYMGTFDAFRKLPLNDYDMYLLTTRTEGLANVIVEACLSEIYVVSVAVGGLPECITNHKNGYLIPDTIDKFNPSAYAKAILAAYKTGECFNQQMIHKESERVKLDHSTEHYQEGVRKAMAD